MVHVLVTGAGGYIGFQTALALRAQGNTVYGLVRKDSDAKLLIAQEITPIIGDISDGKALSDDLLDRVSVVIDNVMNYADKPPLASNRALIKAVHEASKRAIENGGSKKRYIYTSGCLVYGDYPGVVVDETFPLKAKLPRVALEKELIAQNSKELEVTIVRPVWVYGGSRGRYSGGFWAVNAKDEIEVKGNPAKQWSWVHINDLADAYVRVTEAAGALVAGEIFDVADDTRINYEEVRILLARLRGAKGPVVRLAADPDPFSQACEANLVTQGQKIRRVLGWRPRAGVLQDNAKLWFAAIESVGGFAK